MNPIDIIKNYVTRGLTPQSIVKNMTKNNPIFTNLIEMAENGNEKEVENFARNLMKEKGKDFDKEFAEFKNNFR
jgi:hypothetical protein